ncbi:cellular nucleic acid-binding protein homolog [Lathyrus oleraceus]|uniref:cellular nucleic acid-binding protein homolog n=1 Tax=Pisum sativum TaxID=3888 RepID=UPI0021D39FDF|nr:cellular nucleic acid-binding protein homolog [Pisum sativum]
MYDEDIKARSAYYKSVSEKKGKDHNEGKSYSTPTDKGKRKTLDEKRLSGGETSASIKCFKCGVVGHRVIDCKSSEKSCFKYENTGHLIADCKSSLLTCFNRGEPGHISTNFQKANKVQSRGKVFALTRSVTTSINILI